MKLKKIYFRRKSLLIGMMFCMFLLAFAGWGSSREEAQTEVSAGEISEDTVLVGGMPVGIYMETDGVLVLNTQKIEGIDGEMYEPAHNLVRPGDYITEINQVAIEGKKELQEALKTLSEDEVTLTLRREDASLEIRLQPVRCKDEGYKLGIWVRDNVQGLGTITYLTGNSTFGALGHGIHDADTSVLLDITEGRLYQTSIQSVRKGEDGMPGSMEGLIVYNSYNRVGTITKNLETGIYGTLDEIEEVFSEEIPMETAKKEEIQEGDASIRCYVNGEIGEYAVKILETDLSAKEVNKGIVLQITDEALLEETGGIIQGMSGSPIIQNGKLIGAVTHVFVNDPTKGYGIFIEEMLHFSSKE